MHNELAADAAPSKMKTSAQLSALDSTAFNLELGAFIAHMCPDDQANRNFALDVLMPAARAPGRHKDCQDAIWQWLDEPFASGRAA